MTEPAPDHDDTFESLRPLLFSIAYRMLASVAGAEDVVQDAYLRYQRALAAGADIESPKSYLSAIVTRLAIDELTSARVRRERYVGEWLPEPIVTDADADSTGSDPERAAEQSDSLSMAFLLLLERLNPVERAVFLLHDVFGYEFAAVASIVGRTDANCRQIAKRARQAIEADRPRFSPSAEERDRLAARFFAAVGNGDVNGLVELLAADVVVYGDGGGKTGVRQWRRPIVGVQRVARLLGNVGSQLATIGARLEPHRVNGQPGALVLDAEGRLVNVFVLDIVDGAVQTVRSVINPDKLTHLGEPADLRALLERL